MKFSTLCTTLAITLVLAEPVSGQARFNVCNRGSVPVLYAGAFTMFDLFAFRTEAVLQGWFRLEPGQCRNVLQDFYRIGTLAEGHRVWFGYIIEDEQGRRGTALAKPDGDGDGLSSTTQRFCVDPLNRFFRVGTVAQLTRCDLPCPAGSTAGCIVTGDLQPMEFSAVAHRPARTNVNYTYTITPNRYSSRRLFDMAAARQATAEHERRAEEERRQRAESARRQREAAERRAYEQARSTRSLTHVDAYLSTYPNGTWAPEVREIHGALDEAAFGVAEGRNTVAAFEGYIRDFPRGRHRARAQAAVATLDAEAFGAARTRGTTAAYQAYLREHPNGRHRAEAEEAVRALDRDAFDVARRSGTIAAFEGYMAAHPGGRYAAQARSLIDLNRRVEALDVEIRAQQSAVNAARGRATAWGVGSLGALGGTGVLGYFAYREFDSARNLEDELKGLQRGTPEYDGTKADLDDATRSFVIFGAGALAALYMTRQASARSTANRRVAERAGGELRRLEERRAQERRRIDDLLTRRVSIVPHLNDRLEPGIAVRLRF